MRRYEDSVVGGMDRVTWEYLPHQVRQCALISCMPHFRCWQIHVVDMARTPSLSASPRQPPGRNGSALGKYVVTNNLNQALYLFPREQVVHLEERCAFTLPHVFRTLNA